LKGTEYKYGFSTQLRTESLPKGLSRETIEEISRIKNEPSWLLDFRLKAYAVWLKMKEPRTDHLSFSPIDYQDIRYYSAPKDHLKLKSLQEADPELLKTFARLGIPINEQKQLANVALDVVFDSVSIATSFSEQLKELGIVLCSISEAVVKYEELVQRYLATVVPADDNFFAALNSAVFSDGSFVYIPKGVHCPIELSTYFRLNDRETGQFERTLIIAEDDSYVSYLEGCTAPAYSHHQLHAAVVELIACKKAHIRYSTVQNWFSGSPETGEGGVFNFVTKRGLCSGEESKISWTQVEVGAAITWKYPSCILQGDGSRGEFYSVALTNGVMQADTGTKMIHIGKNTKSNIISKGISADNSSNVYRGTVSIGRAAKGSRNYTKCDSMLIGSTCSAHTIPTIESRNSTAQIEHEASTSKISDEQMFYLRSRGLTNEDAVKLLINGFCGVVLEHLPLEFAMEAKNLLSIKLEHSVG
jgi:Fe-S cluster assembly protein SufB